MIMFGISFDLQNLVKIRLQGASHKKVKYNACVTFCIFPSLPFLFCLLAVLYRKKE